MFLSRIRFSGGDGKGFLAKRRYVAVLLWAVFASGLLIQAFAPRLDIANNAFVIPPTLAEKDGAFRPGEIVALERRLQVISAIVTICGALGLAFYYRHLFVRSNSS